MKGIKSKFDDLCRTVGLHMSQLSTNPSLLKELLLKLRPVDCGIELIRIGGNNDGGYLVPNDLEGIEYCFSPGVNTIANFENECLQRGISSFLADYSVERPPIELTGCHFLKKFVGAYNNIKTITLEKWVSESLPKDYKRDLILQMDIEGCEYETLLATPVAILEKFRILVVEFHNFHTLDNIEYYNVVNTTIEKIKETFEPVHIHVNNFSSTHNVNGVLIPSIFEATFLRKDRGVINKRLNSLPHALDQPNDPDKKDLQVPVYWQ